MAEEKVTLDARCRCKLVSFKLEIPKSALPLKSSICHCNSCRKTSGQVFGTFAVPPVPMPDFSHLSAYQSSAKMTRYFCPRCGACVGDKDEEAGEWDIATGLLSRTAGLLRRDELWVEDTGDGGASVWLPNRKAKRLRGRDSEAVGNSDVQAMSVSSPTPSPDNRLRCNCRCEGVELYLTRPHNEPTPDPDHGRWWANEDNTKFLGSIDTCNDCRYVTGMELASWVEVPALNVEHKDGSQYDYAGGTLKSYESSPGIHRDFCGRCGATVFFRKDSRTRDVVDLAAGMMDGESGVRAEEWVEWAKSSYLEDAVDEAFARELGEGLGEWLKERKGAGVKLQEGA